MLMQRNMVKLSEQAMIINGFDFKELRAQMGRLSYENISRVHRDQHICSQVIISEFEKNPDLLMIMAVGKTQSGKTGVMYSCIQDFTEPNEITGYHVPVKNIYLITGLSSTEWKEQTKTRIPGILSSNIFHRPDLKGAFMDSIKDKKNILILIDEVQIACGGKQTISNEFKEIGLLNIQHLMENDIKIVEFSATPNGTLGDCEYWKDHCKIVKVNPGNGYVGCSDILAQNRVFQCKDLCESDKAVENILEIKKVIEDSFKEPRYHIIRTKTGAFQKWTIDAFKSIFNEDCEYLLHDSSNISNLDEYLGGKDSNGVKPDKHTFIFIKEMARCAKTFEKKNIGIWYERIAKNMRDDIVIQGLLGRATGYDDNGDSIVFTNISSIVRYEELWNSDFSNEVEWNSNTTTYSEKKKITIAKKTFNGKVLNGVVGLIQEKCITTVTNHIYINEDDMSIKEFWNANKPKNSRNPFTDKNSDNGFYMSSTTGNKKVYLRSEIESFCKNLKGASGFDISKEKMDKTLSGEVLGRRAYICYNDFSEDSKEYPIIYIRTIKKI